jgi:hypothetical protein
LSGGKEVELERRNWVIGVSGWRRVMTGGSHQSLGKERERVTPSGFSWVGNGPLAELG